MNVEHYDLKADANRMDFEFMSVGPNGKIKKVVRYSLQHEDYMYFNLGFGDLNEETGELDDLSKSNNGDKDKILATVAVTVIKFTYSFPNALVYVKGSTPVRTRLYQMAIASNWTDINEVLFVFGYKNGQWVDFEINVNYSAFMVLHK